MNRARRDRALREGPTMDDESPMAKAAKQIQAERRASEQPTPQEEPTTKKLSETNENIRAIVDRIVRLEEEKQSLSTDIKAIYQEARSAGFEPKAVKIAVKREMETAEQKAAREAVEAEAALILAALGEFAGTPLGKAAVQASRG